MGLSDAYGIDFAQAHKLGQGAKDRLYGTLAFLLHVFSLLTLYAFYRSFVFWFIVRYSYTFFIALAFTCCCIGTTPTVFSHRSIMVYLNPFYIWSGAFEQQPLIIPAQIIIPFIVVGKIIGASL